MSTWLLATVAMSIIGHGVIYLGLAFVNGQLAPAHLDGVYQSTNEATRIFIMLLLASWPANYIFSNVYQTSPSATWAGMVILGTLVCVLIAKAYFLGDVSFSFRGMCAVTMLFVGAVWTAWELGKGAAH